MRNVLIFAGIAGIAAAIAIYFVSEADKNEASLLADDALDAANESLDRVGTQARKSFHAMN